MIFLRQKAYTDLVAEAALARAMAARVAALEAQNDKLLDTILKLRVGGAELPPGHGEEGFGKYTFDEVDEEAMSDDLPPSPRLPDEMDEEEMIDIARALGLEH